MLLSLFTYGFIQLFFYSKSLFSNEQIKTSPASYEVQNDYGYDHYEKIQTRNKFGLPREEKMRLYDTMGDVLFQGEAKKQANVCLVGDFSTEDAQGTIASMLLNKRYNGDILQFDYVTNTYATYRFDPCEVLVYTPLIPKKKRNPLTFKKIEEFMTQYKGIVIVPAGNSGDASDRSEWAAYKKAHKNTLWYDRVLIISQGAKANGVFYPIGSAGEKVDFMVANNYEYVKSKPRRGSVYASAVVASVAANLIASGVPLQNVKEVISTRAVKDESGNSYYLLDIEETYEKASAVSN